MMEKKSFIQQNGTIDVYTLSDLNRILSLDENVKKVYKLIDSFNLCFEYST